MRAPASELVLGVEAGCRLMKQTLGVGDNLGDGALHEGNGGVGGAEIDTDHGALDLGVGALIAAAELRRQRLPGDAGGAAGDGRGSGKL